MVALFCVTAIASYGQTVFTNVASFDGGDGASPQSSLIQGADGNFYGTARFGGLVETSCGPSCGTAFRLTPEGALAVFYNFCSEAGCEDGANPGGLLLASNGSTYGITEGGGAGSHCTITGGCGTAFQITAAGMVTTLYSFCSQADCADGYVGWTAPSLIQATNGNFYGTTGGGGAYGYGTVFEITPSGKLTSGFGRCSSTAVAVGSIACVKLSTFDKAETSCCRCERTWSMSN